MEWEVKRPSKLLENSLMLGARGLEFAARAVWVQRPEAVTLQRDRSVSPGLVEHTQTQWPHQ